MYRVYGWNDILVMRDDLIGFAWSAPMRDLAPKVELSDVGLKKMLTSHGISTPPQGYWNKVQAGKPVPDVPKAQPRRPGETGRVRVSSCFADVLSPAAPIPSSGPFASALVPEDLQELRATVIHEIGRASVPKTLNDAHRDLRAILAKEERRRAKAASSGWASDGPLFDNPVGKRRLRLLNGIFLILSKIGHSGDAYERDGEIQARALVGDTWLSLSIEVSGKHRTTYSNGYSRPARDLPPSTPLALQLDPSFDGKAVETWCDDAEGQLEEKIAAIVAGIVVAGEAGFRRSLREAEVQAELQRVAAEERRRNKLAALNRERLENLSKSSELLRRAENLRSLIERVGEAILQNPEVSSDEFSAWKRWALAEADKLDPICSGQFLSHLKLPPMED